MTKKTFFIRLAGFVVIALAALPVYSLAMVAMVVLQLVPQDLMDTGYGNDLTFRAVVVWCGTLVPGFAGIFPKENWRYVLYFSPLYAPALYAVIYTLAQ